VHSRKLANLPLSSLLQLAMTLELLLLKVYHSPQWAVHQEGDYEHDIAPWTTLVSLVLLAAILALSMSLGHHGTINLL